MLRHKLIVSVAAVILTLMIAELTARWLDGYRLVALTLVRTGSPHSFDIATSRTTDARHINEIPLARGVRPEWYSLAPVPRQTYPLPPALQSRLDRYPRDRVGALAEWNINYLHDALCSGVRRGSLGILDDFLVFTPSDGAEYPTYRALRHVSAPGVYTTNNFGWRGPDISLRKPPDTIRVAFVGASTTIDDYSIPFSHPEYVEHWLNMWAAATGRQVHVEVINAGRTGIDSRSIAAIVRQEVLPVEPDLIVYYEGANEFAPASLVTFADGAPVVRPTATFREPNGLERSSALVRRLVIAIKGTNWRVGGAEPPKPPYVLAWPPDVDEHHPDPLARTLPMHLERVIANLDAIRRAANDVGAELGVVSFRWMVEPGMVLDLRRHLALLEYLNETYFPVSYAVMRRMADFQNRVFERYAAARHLTFFDFDRDFPHDPGLFSDAVHLTEAGVRLEAWYYLQQLVPMLADRIDRHVWPRAARLQPPPAAHPAFANEPGLVIKASLLAECHNKETGGRGYAR